MSVKSQSIKRQGYLYGLAGATVAVLLGVYFERMTGQANAFDAVALPLLAVVFAALMVAFLRARSRVWPLELATFFVLASFFLLKLGFVLYDPTIPDGDINDHLGEFGYWYPTLYATILFILGIEAGARMAVVHYLLALLIGAPYMAGSLLEGASLQVVYSLLQLYVSSAVLIMVAVVSIRYTARIARDRAEMERLAHTDAVTSIANRRQMERLIEHEVRRAERHGGGFSLLILDLDHFKRVNDLHGHAVGDEVLRGVSSLLRSTSRAVDHVGRWGGEEFIVILPNITDAAALAVAARLKTAIEEQSFGVAGHVTASIGSAAYEAGDTMATIVDKADRALYRAKLAGRNRIVAHGRR